MEGYTELYFHDTMIPVIIMFVLHLKVRKIQTLGAFPFPGRCLQEHDLTGAVAENLVRGAQLPKVLQQKVLKAHRNGGWEVVITTIGGLLGNFWRF